MKPSQSKQPCNPANKGRVTNYYNEVAAWTSMDEFAMAVMVEGGLHGSYGAGFRCIDQRENSRKFSYIRDSDESNLLTLV